MARTYRYTMRVEWSQRFSHTVSIETIETDMDVVEGMLWAKSAATDGHTLDPERLEGVPVKIIKENLGKKQERIAVRVDESVPKSFLLGWLEREATRSVAKPRFGFEKI